ncbi:MPN domain-containing protein [Planctomicrobium piriforme]|uniref:hypothetical protein n=1 Tax=Planctomicrobium piriforme TaxID=1576369 RepID=UPI000B80F1FF|nr:hypothetical protein [Planctomicrobium piriforme]
MRRRPYRRPRRKRPLRRPALRFSPPAWAKLLFLRDLGPTEVGAFGISRPDGLLLVHELALIQQSCTSTFVSFEDAAVAAFFDAQVDQGRRPEEFGRIWIHTHPGSSPQPSRVDRETFQRAFGHCDWAVMCILARSGDCFAELSWRCGGPARWPLAVEVDYGCPFPAAEPRLWEEEYAAAVAAEAAWTDFSAWPTRRWQSQGAEYDRWAADTMVAAAEQGRAGPLEQEPGR